MTKESLYLFLSLLLLFSCLYYYFVIKYSRYLEKKDDIKNIKNKVANVNNIYNFEKNYEDVISYKNDIVPVNIDSKSRDWEKDLFAINSQQNFVENNNLIVNHINDIDLDDPSLN